MATATVHPDDQDLANMTAGNSPTVRVAAYLSLAHAAL